MSPIRQDKEVPVRISVAVIHQQLRQLLWHILACFALIMVLPIEEGIVNFRDGEGFYASYIPIFCVTFTPLLTGLIGCVNVQADLGKKRYIFWRSKPAGTKSFIALKYFIGLIVILLMMASPIVFWIVSCALCNRDRQFELMQVMPLVVLGIMTYSLCFACNVVIRKSARAWLVAMLLACFVLFLPFVLPLGYKDSISDIIEYMPVLYIAITLSVSTVAFIFALYAGARDWHLKINLKKLLWAALALAFTVMMIFSTQVANIKVLQEKQLKRYGGQFGNIDGKIVLGGAGYIDIDKDNISLRPVFTHFGKAPAFREDIHAEKYKGYYIDAYPHGWARFAGPFKTIQGQLWAFEIQACYREEDVKHADTFNAKYTDRYYVKHTDKFDNVKYTYRFYEKLYVRSYKLIDNYWQPSAILDISDCLRKGKPDVAVRLIGNNLVACVNVNYSTKSSVIVADVTNPEDMKIIDKKTGSFKPFPHSDNQKDFALALIPTDGISMEEKIKLSIDSHYFLHHYYNRIHLHSIVDIDNGNISFIVISQEGISRFDVTHWDDRKIYCKLSTKRSFTILERISGDIGHGRRKPFVQNGMLYITSDHNLMVFDIRSDRRIRKLGHFVRANCTIQDIAALENGNILMTVTQVSEWQNERDRRKREDYLYLLKDPR